MCYEEYKIQPIHGLFNQFIKLVNKSNGDLSFDDDLTAKLKNRMEQISKDFGIESKEIWISLIRHNEKKSGTYYSQSKENLDRCENDLIPIFEEGMEKGVITAEELKKCRNTISLFKLM